MNEFAAKKKETAKLEAAKGIPVANPIYVSGLTEGIFKESQKVEQHGRTSFEKSVQIEKKAIVKALKKETAKRGEKKKPAYGWKLADGRDEPGSKEPKK